MRLIELKLDVFIFMDTAGFLALWDAADEHHERALCLQTELARKGRRFLPPDYVVDEAVTLLLVRNSRWRCRSIPVLVCDRPGD